MKKKSLTKNYIYNSIYQVFAIIVPLITTPYIAKVLLPDNVGIHSYVNSVVTLFTTIGLLGLSNYSVREIAYTKSNRDKLDKTFSELYFLRIIFFLITFTIYFIYSYNTEYFLYYMLYSFTVVGTFFDIAWLFQGVEELGVTVVRSFIIKLISTISIFVFVRSINDLWILVLIYSLTTFFGSLVLYFSAKKIIKKVYLKDLNIKRHVIPNIKLFLPQVATLIYCQFDKIMINDLTNEVAQVGFYNQAEKIIKIPLTLITSLSTVMLPRISEEFINKNINNLKQLVSNAFRFSLLLAIPLTLGIISVAGGLIPWFLGEKYLEVTPILMLISITVIFISISNVSGAQYLTATNNTKVLTISYLISAVINLILNFIFIRYYGAVGATIGTITAEFLVVFIQLKAMKDIIKVKDIFKFSKNYIYAGLVMTLTCFSLYYIIRPSILLTLLQISIGIIVYFSMLFILKDDMFNRYFNRFINKFKSIFNKSI